MSLYVRTIAGAMLDLRACPLLTIEDGGDGQLLAHGVGRPDRARQRVRHQPRDRSRRNVETLLNQLAARANGEASPIEADPMALRRGMRFGQPQRAGRNR